VNLTCLAAKGLKTPRDETDEISGLTWWLALSCVNVPAAIAAVFGCRGKFAPKISVLRIGFWSLHCFEHTLQIGPAPATPRTSPITIGKLTGSAGLFQGDEIGNLTPGDMKTETQFFVGLHSADILFGTKRIGWIT
jgi:hypothetical protein